MKTFFCLLFFILFTFQVILVSGGRQTARSPDVIQAVNSVSLAQSNVAKSIPTGWNVASTVISGGKPLESVFFIDSKHGWVGGQDALYKTNDGGKTWSPVKINITEDSAVVGIYFANPSMGWITVEPHWNEIIRIEDSEFFIMFTNDGGRSWNVQYNGKHAVPVKTGFVNDRIGWVTAKQYKPESYPRVTNLVLHTNDQGRNWTDVSSGLRIESAKINRKYPDNRAFLITELIPEGLHNATVLGDAGDMFTTTDDGLTWQSAGRAPGSTQQRALHSFGRNANGEFWASGGSSGTEGYSGVFAIRSKDDSWLKYEIGGYVADAKFLSNKDFVASGLKLVDGKFRGVVMITSDEGRNWSILYQGSLGSTIEKLFTVDAHHIWAIGDEGLVVRLQYTE